MKKLLGDNASLADRHRKSEPYIPSISGCSVEVRQTAFRTKATLTSAQVPVQRQLERTTRKRYKSPLRHEEPFLKRRKVRKEPTEECTLLSTKADTSSVDDQHPIAYWAMNKQWPLHYVAERKDIESILARKRSISSRSIRISETASTPPSSTNQGEPKSREQKSAKYKKPQYETVLATKGVKMKSSLQSVTATSKSWCRDLLERV